MGLTKTERFKRWRGVKAGEEQMFIDTANHVDAYLLSASYLRIKQDLSHGEGEKSEQYELIQKAPKPGTSILLHCKLDIEEAADLLSGPAKKTLKRLEYHLGSLYSNYANKPAERVEALLNSFAALLELEISVFSDRKRARNLYHTIYFALGSTDKKLTNLPPGVGFLARFYGIDIEKSHSSVKALMRRIEDRMMVFGTDMKLEELDDDLDSDDSTEESHDATGVTVDTQLNSQQGSGTLLEKGAQIKAVTGAQVDTVTGQVGAVTTTLLSVDANKPQTEKAQAVAVEAEQDPLTPEQQAIQKYFNQRYLAVLNNDESADKKLQDLLVLITEVTHNIGRYASLCIYEQKILEKKVQITELLNAFTNNDKKAIGRKYFLELVKEHQAGFELLMKDSASARKDALLANIEQQKAQSNTWKATVLTVASYASSVFTAAGRFFAPKKIQELQDIMPDTLDSEAKAWIKEIAAELLVDMEQQLVAIRTEKEEKLRTVSHEDAALPALISNEIAASLLEIVKVNSVIKSYEDLAPGLKASISTEDSLSLPEAEAPLAIKTSIQDCFQARYLNVFQSDGEEKAKVATVVAGMKEVVIDLNKLIQERTKKEELLVKIQKLQGVIATFKQGTPNKIIGAVANEPLKELKAKVDAIDQEIALITSKLSVGNARLRGMLAKDSLDNLREIIKANTVEDTIDSLLLNIVTAKPAVEVFVAGSKTIQDYFNEQYIALLTHDSNEEEQRLTHVITHMIKVDKGIETLLAARKNKDELILKCHQLSDIIEEMVIARSNSLLINLAKQRLKFLEENAKIAEQKEGELANNLSSGNSQFKQLLIQEQPDILLKVTAANQAANECIEEYRGLRQNLVLLADLWKGDSALHHYATQNYTWWVRLTNWLAEFCSIFKSKAGEMIDEANALKGRLAVCRIQCEQEIKAQIEVIKSDNNLGDELLGDLPGQHNYQAVIIPPEATPFDQDHAKGLLAGISLFSPNFSTDKRRGESSLSKDDLDLVDEVFGSASTSYSASPSY